MRVACEAARLVAAGGIPVNGPLVEAAALLHDIDKPETRAGVGEHGVVGAARMIERGWEELALPIASHPVTALLDDDRHPKGWESVIVSVADRHVAQEFLTTDERIDDLVARHPQHSSSLEAARRPAAALEREVADAAGLEVDELVSRLRAAWEAGA
ncbi:MAG TPA: HDIG domain-containing protein [Candidatus Limnocylindria bacterium]|nr:HDIG domain-containing protein [Candidatus Limnocylindria bacterium]